MRFDITVRQVTGSTNDDVWELARAGAPEGACVMALRQVSGRGQWKRVWESPAGGLYFSFLLRPQTPQDRWAEMSPAIADAMAAVLREVSGAADGAIRVKLPNDVVCDAGKLCGTVLEAKDGALVVGCGVNVFRPETPIVTDGRNVPAYLCDQGVFWQRHPELADDPAARQGFLEHLARTLLDAIAARLGLGA